MHRAGYISHTAVSGRELDDLRIFKKGLTPEEVQQLYTNTAEPPPAPAPNPQEVLAAKSGGYRYGFNGQEHENEITGSQTHYSAEFWMYDARLGRRWNLDPKPNPQISSYGAFANSPLLFNDPLGDTIGPRNTPQTGKAEGMSFQTLENGDYFSDVQKQTYSATFGNVSKASWDGFLVTMSTDPGDIINNFLADYSLIDRDGSYGVTVGDHFDIDIYGPDNGSVEVTSLVLEENMLFVQVTALKGHPDAGTNTFSAVFNPISKEMTWSTHNVSRTKDGVLGLGAGYIHGRDIQQKQWENVMVRVYQVLGRPNVISAQSEVREFDYNDFTKKIGTEEKGEYISKDLKPMLMSR